MPDPQPATTERAAIWQRSHLRGVLWDIGDITYYLGLLATVILPLTLLANEIPRIPSRGILPTIAMPLLCLITAFPTGLVVCLGMKKLARGNTVRNSS